MFNIQVLLRYNSQIHPFKVLKPMVFNIFRIVQTVTTIILKVFSSSQKEIPYPLAVNPHFSYSSWKPLTFLSLLIYLFCTFPINGII